MEYKQRILDLGKERVVTTLCNDTDLGRATFYRWRQDARENLSPGPKGPDAEILEAMRLEIRELDHVKRRTWGTEAIYEEYERVIPKSLITEVIQEERRRKSKAEREAAIRYEFVAPDIAWSDDFIDVKPEGRVLRVQDERSRLILGYEHRASWPDSEVARFVHAAFERYGAPLFFKHDLGSEFRSGVFQSMLRGSKVMALPNPPHYPRYNGKHERTNRSVRHWLASLEDDKPTLEEVLSEMRLALLDHNLERRKEALDGRTPEESYRVDPRVNIDRAGIYSEWNELKEKLVKLRKFPSTGRIDRTGEFQAMRIAAITVLRRHQWVRYFGGPEAPELSH